MIKTRCEIKCNSKAELKQELIKIIKEGKDILESFKNLLFPPKKEPKEIELKYGIKEREENILADTIAMRFQPVNNSIIL